MLDRGKKHLASKSIKIVTGTIVDDDYPAPSTRNEKKEHDPAMRQTRKGHQWYFGTSA
jgi:IS5 family transposase